MLKIRKEKKEKKERLDSVVSETNLIGLFFKDVRKLEEFTKQEEDELWDKYFKTKDKNLLLRILQSHMRFVIKTCNEYKTIADYYKVDMQDLYQEASIGLLQAGEKYSQDKNVRFISYAVHWIRQGITSFLNSFSREIRLPVNKVQEMQKNKKKSEEAFKNEIFTDEFDMEIPTVQSIYTKINDYGDELIDIIPGEPSQMELDNYSVREELEKLINNDDVLDDRERTIIKCYYGFNNDIMNLEDIGDEMGLTKERVRQLKEQALKKLRTNGKTLFKFK